MQRMGNVGNVLGFNTEGKQAVSDGERKRDWERERCEIESECQVVKECERNREKLNSRPYI